MKSKDDLLLIVTYTIIFLLVFLIAIIIFIIQSRKDRLKIEEKKKEIEIIAKQKTTLLKEIHHRVKNNLQLISGLLYLQSVKHRNPEVTAMIDESQKHINSIALVHEMLYQDKTLAVVSMEKYLKELGTRLLQLSHQNNIAYTLEIKDVSLPIDYATTIGLLCNELITNSLKYAFTKEEGRILVSLKEMGTNEYIFTYSDSGKGFDVDQKNNSKKTLGQSLIKMLAEQIEADLTISNIKELTYSFKFKIRIK